MAVMAVLKGTSPMAAAMASFLPTALFLLSLTTPTAATQDYLLGIPTVPFTSHGDTFDLHTVRSIVIDAAHAHWTDQDGWTEIPPTLAEFAQTFSEDLWHLTGWNVSVKESPTEDFGAAEADVSSLVLALNSSVDGFTDAAGRHTSEAYAIDVTGSMGIKITGSSPLGVWWGTRTVLQQAVLNQGRIATGTGVDAPGWGVRGIFLDGGRHFYPIEFLTELCNWISFWKQNTLHLHLSDNLYNNVKIYSHERQLELYSAFRLWSEDPALAGLNKRQNESYTRAEFDQLQTSCAKRGVTVIPEIEAPGHALVFTQWKPELAMEGQIDLLNLSNPDSTTQMKTVWKTFLPWFHSKVVHIGADEYVDSQLSKNALAEVYNTFVNTMSDFIYEQSGKEIRIWGTFPPSDNYTEQIFENVTIQHWEFFEDNPLFDYINAGISVINSDDSFYIVQKYSTPYPQELNKTRIFHGNPATSGPWAPNIFDVNNATNNPPRDSSFVPGHIAAQWNDYGPNTSTYLEGYYPWRYYLPALADKQWGGSLTEAEYDQIYTSLQLAAPGQNLDRNVASKTATIVEYATFETSSDTGKVADTSGNGYDAVTNCNVGEGGAVVLAGKCAVTTPLTSKGNDYTVSLSLMQSAAVTGPILTGPDSALWSGNGSSTQLMLYSAGNAFALNYSLPVGSWVDGSLIARGNRTFFVVDGGDEMEFLTQVGVNGERHEWVRIAVVAPLAMIGGGDWEGEVKSLKVVNHAL